MSRAVQVNIIYGFPVPEESDWAKKFGISKDQFLSDNNLRAINEAFSGSDSDCQMWFGVDLLEIYGPYHEVCPENLNSLFKKRHDKQKRYVEEAATLLGQEAKFHILCSDI